MSDAKLIYAELRQPLLRAGAALGVLLTVMIAAGSYNTHMSQARASAEQHFKGTVQEYRTAMESEQILRTETERFTQLRARGFVGPEPRLRWVEDVRETAARAGLLTIRYELEPRTAHPTSISTGSFQLFASLMRLELELRHEGDLLSFLKLLDERRSGLFELSACALRHTREEGDISLQEGNVKADCELRWYSLDAAVAAPVGEAQ
ncbi:MAG: hypothetical protein HZB57_10035 [Gammaproteobacteria bacterium]|nr:hypothetical protein [Gammaproteobacteria bacterium]